MKYKLQSGITLVSLTITIIVLSIIAGVAVYAGLDVIETAEVQTLNTNMLLIQIKCKTLSEKATFEKDDTLLKGTTVTSIMESASGDEYTKVNDLINKGVISTEEEHYNKYYLLTNQDLIDMGLEDAIVENEYYIINYETEEVIYTKGVEIEDVTYYKLSELQNSSSSESI